MLQLEAGETLPGRGIAHGRVREDWSRAVDPQVFMRTSAAQKYIRIDGLILHSSNQKFFECQDFELHNDLFL